MRIIKTITSLCVASLAILLLTSTSFAATMGEKNALRSADSYLAFSAFSYEGLIDQLEYEGFTHDQAIYGVTQNGY